MNDQTNPPAVPQPQNSKAAVTSLVFGILSLVLCGVGAIFAIPGLILGILGMNRVRKSGGTQKGHGLALAGTIMSGLSLLLLPVVGMMAAIAIPNFVKARNSAQYTACVSNLRMIDGAKATWTLEGDKKPSDVPTDADLFGADKYIVEKPTCPMGGTYSLNSVAEKPTCSVPGHEF